MPAFTVTIAGKTYCVEIPNPGANPLQVIVDGEAFEVNVAGVLSGQAGDAPAVTPVRQPAALASSPASPAPAGAGRPVTAPQTVMIGSSGGCGSAASEVKAPMPGTLLSVEVHCGQAVERAEVLCVLEAMKMKNPIRAPRAGTVIEILAGEGDTVAYGDVLLRMA